MRLNSVTRVPANPRIYHITHVDNLPQIVETGMLLSDADRVARNLNCRIVGMSNIKTRRLLALPVRCHPDTNVGQCVPFYFCPRSVMLYLLHMGNHPELDYRGGQRPILHLAADLRRAVQWAEANHRPWAFSDMNAGAGYANFFKNLDDLDKINWPAVSATDWRDPVVKDGKQAEFLVYESFPWELVEGVGVLDAGMQQQVNQVLRNVAHKPLVTVQQGWYY